MPEHAPDYPLPTNKTNLTEQEDDHPLLHNAFARTLNFLQLICDALAGTDANLQQQLNDIAASGSDATAVAAALANHLADTTSAHVASSLGMTPFTGVAGPDIQTALTQIYAAAIAGGGGVAHAITSPDDSVVSIVKMDKTAYDAIAPGTAGFIYITKPEA